MSKKDTSDYRSKIERFIGVPAGSMSNSAHFEINGNHEAIIEGCRNILQYDREIIKIDIGRMSVTFEGRNLSLKSFSTNSLIIEGFISSVNFIT